MNVGDPAKDTLGLRTVVHHLAGTLHNIARHAGQHSKRDAATGADIQDFARCELVFRFQNAINNIVNMNESLS
jgi:hypothetical protein